MKRPDNRNHDQLRPIKLTADFVPHAEGSVLIEIGDTHVVCTASIDENVPPHLKGSGTGWITAEYAMMPRATAQRTKRERGTHLGGRTQEIQRLIGRALRSVSNLSALGEHTIILDCDVLRADGGTRTASITGSFMALAQATALLKRQHNIMDRVLDQHLAAVSVGMVDGVPCLDLCYEEDFKASVDMNVVAVQSGDFVEIQGTGEEATFSRKQTDELLDLALAGIDQLIQAQKTVVSDLP